MSCRLSVVGCQWRKAFRWLFYQPSTVNRSLFSLFVFSLLLLTQCKSDKPNPKPEVQVTSLAGNSNVLVTNEGTFQFKNASLSYVSGANGAVQNDIRAENKWDVVQSAFAHQGLLYVVVNNESKIEILDDQNFSVVGTIAGLPAPRYMLMVGNAKAYVTNIYGNEISVVDLNTRTVVKRIRCEGWTEELVLHLGKVYVTNYWKPYLYVIDPATDTKNDSILIGEGAQSIVTDKFDRLVISSGGYKIPQEQSKIIFLNPYTKTIEKKIAFPMDYPGNLRINVTKDSLYYLKTNVYKMALSATDEPSAFFISGQGKSFYGLGIDPRSNRVFVSDAVDYIQKGKIYVYTSTGVLVSQFSAGVIPNGFCFY